MKRKDNLYENICKMENIMAAYDEVCRNSKNKRRVKNYKEYKCVYISRVYNVLKNRSYVVGPYNYFTIYEPKERLVVSQSLHDKLINHLVSRHILFEALMPCLIDANVASRKGLGTGKALEMFKEFKRKCDINYGSYYILKCDIRKFFSKHRP